MGKTPEQVDELLKLVRDEDISTLRALERRLLSLLEQKERDEALSRHGGTDRELLLNSDFREPLHGCNPERSDARSSL